MIKNAEGSIGGGREANLCEDPRPSTAIPGVLNSAREVLLNGGYKYKRILIRKI